ncbi:MAG: energy transducer TonB [Bacteroidota bacterium]
MNTRPEVTDEEIQGYMNFDSLLSQKKQILDTRKRRIIRNASLGIVCMAIIGSTIWWQTDTPSLRQSNIVDATAPRVESENSSVPQQDSVAVQSEKKTKTKAIPPGKQLKAVPQESEPRKPIVEEESPAVTTPVYVQAEPMNGYPDLYQYFAQELRYPDAALKDSIEGEVIVVCTINRQGKPENIQIENSLGLIFDVEVKRVIENMPAWKPATYNGKPVPSKISLPLTFRITKLIVK